MQGDLFSTGALAFNNGPDLPLQREQLLAWQERLHAHQAPLFRGERCHARPRGICSVPAPMTLLRPSIHWP